MFSGMVLGALWGIGGRGAFVATFLGSIRLGDFMGGTTLRRGFGENDGEDLWRGTFRFGGGARWG